MTQVNSEKPAPLRHMNTHASYLAVALAQEAAKISTMDAFVYISASDIFPLVDPRYISSKRQAEKYLFSRPEFRTIALRPGRQRNGNAIKNGMLIMGQ